MLERQQIARLTGFGYLVVFALGILTYQFLRGPYVFADDYVVKIIAHESEVTWSIFSSLTGGIVSISVAVLLLPVFEKLSPRLGYFYLAFCLISFVTLAIENQYMLSLLEYARISSETGGEGVLSKLGVVAYASHKWSHYLYLLVSCLPVFVLYLSLYIMRLVPRLLSIFGMVAAVLMALEMGCTLLGVSTGMDLLLPMGLVQLFLPFWLIFSGFRSVDESLR